jgi:hypothetical protein
VDFAISSHDRISYIDHKAVNQAVEREFSEPLGKRGRALYVDEQECALLQPRPVIVAGDEIEQHILSEQVVDVIDEPYGQNHGKGEQHVLVPNWQPNPYFCRDGKQPDSDGKTDQNNKEIDDGLYGEMRQERQPAQLCHCSSRPDLLEHEQSAGDNDTGEYATREAAKAEQRRAV